MKKKKNMCEIVDQINSNAIDNLEAICLSIKKTYQETNASDDICMCDFCICERG